MPKGFRGGVFKGPALPIYQPMCRFDRGRRAGGER
jgi:hypothetical protein